MPTSMRPATAEDRPWLLVLRGSDAPFEPDLDIDGGDLRVVWRDRDRVGVVRLEHDAAVRLHVGHLEVASEHRGQGIGTIVIRALDEEAARAGDALTVRLPPGAGARVFFERLGFRPVTGDEDGDGVLLQLG